MLTNTTWFLFIGLLLLAMGLTAPLIKRLPVTSAVIYLSVGMIVGPMGLELFHFNPLEESGLLELLTEVAVLISLFAAGVKMPVPITFSRWRNPIRLAFLSMTVTVALVALFSHYLLGLSPGAAILLGAIIAPTDPVLATEVQIRQPGDRDRLRFALTCEAGMNDGTAFPFVMLGMGLLGLHELGAFGLNWLLVDLLWGTLGAILIGVVCGSVLAHLIAYLRQFQFDSGFLDDFLGLGLIGTVYGLSTLSNTWGFLAVFFSAVALRQAELRIAGARDERERKLRDESLGSFKDSQPSHSVSEASLVFKEHLERLSEVVLILLIGGMLFADSWSWRAVGFSLFVFTIARPLSVLIGFVGSGAPQKIRGMAGWFGVRGIGSLYYLMYAIQHGLPRELSMELIHLTLIVVTLSIFLHGISVKPLFRRFWMHRRSRDR